MPAHGETQARAREAHQAPGHEAINERLRGALDRAKPVALEQEEPGHELGRKEQAHEERAHEDERERVRHRERDDSWDYGL